MVLIERETHLTIRKKITFEEISNAFHDIKIVRL